eukprot:1318580-Pleurochrysis_carterae.AAC.1
MAKDLIATAFTSWTDRSQRSFTGVQARIEVSSASPSGGAESPSTTGASRQRPHNSSLTGRLNKMPLASRSAQHGQVARSSRSAIAQLLAAN